jgi:hyaluronan synthase
VDLIVCDQPLAQMLAEVLDCAIGAEPRMHKEYVRQAHQIVKNFLIMQKRIPVASLRLHNSVVCFAQPHTNVRGIRFAAWVLSLVIAEANDIQYIWSSDSDTVIVGNCMLKVLETLNGDPRMGGISTAISVQKVPYNAAALLGWTQHRCLIYLDAAFTASIGRSSCLTGPSTMFRADALAQAIFPWYLGGEAQSEGGPRMMANDDNQITTWLGRMNWKRGYLTECHVMTLAPGTLFAWIRQQCRWNRAYNHERFQHFWYSVDQGPLYLWWIARDEVYDAIFGVNALCLLFKSNGYGTHYSELLSYFVAQPIYNYMRSPEAESSWYDLIILPGLLMFHHVSIQFVHMWSALTPFEDVENTPAGERGLRQKQKVSNRDRAFVCWLILAEVTLVQLLFSCIISL